MARFAHVLSVVLFVILLVGLSVTPTWAVLPPQLSASSDTGTRAFVSYSGAKENINLTNGNLNVAIPLISLPGRNGHDFTLSILYDSKNWMAKANPFDGTVLHYYWTLETRPGGIGSQGWRLDIPSIQGGDAIPDPNNPGSYLGYGDFIITLPGGGKSWIPYRGPSFNDTELDSEDGSLIHLNMGAVGGPIVTLTNGTKIYFAGFSPGGSTGASKIEDTEGNYITFQSISSPPSTLITDTVGRQVTINYSSSGPWTITYKDSNGTLQTISLNFSSYTLFQTSGQYQTPQPPFTYPLQKPNAHPPVLVQIPAAGSVTNSLLSSVTLPAGKTYAFQYNGYGELSKINYPTGGYTSYVYSVFRHQETYYGDSQVNGLVDFREVTQKKVCKDPSGSCPGGEDITTYAPDPTDSNNNSIVDVTDPTGARTRYSFADTQFPDKFFTPVETDRAIYSSSGTLVRTIHTDYIPMGTSLENLLPVRVTTTLSDASQVTKIEYTYDTYTAKVLLPVGIDPNFQTLSSATRYDDNVVQELVYDYGTGAPGSLLRKRTASFLHVNAANANVDYSNTSFPHILDLKTIEQTWDPLNNKLAETQYEYDSFTEGLTASGAAQHTSSFNTSFLTRGKQTAVKQWRNTDGTYLTTRLQYDDAGNNRKIADPRGNSTIMSYADSWGDATCTPSGGSAVAYLTSTTNPLGHITTATYNSCAGTTASTKDPNNVIGNYSYDSMNRSTLITYPSTGQTITTCYSDVAGSSCYNALPPLKMVTTSTIASSINMISTSIVDGLGRVVQTQLNSDPEGVDYIDVTYDSKSRKATVSNPHRASSLPTDGITTYQYDSLDRVTQVAPPDGTLPIPGSTCLTNNVCTSYLGNLVTITDQAGKKRKTQIDALGRLVTVWEDPNSSNYETDYLYDVLGNLLRVDQKGGSSNSANWRTRTFTYDSLSRLLAANNPESGTLTYKYDSDTNCASPNSYPTLLVSKTDARGIRTCMQYDALNRQTQKNYSDGTPTANFYYDTAPATWANGEQNTVGRMVEATTGPTPQH